VRLTTSERLAVVAARWAVALDPEGELDADLADALAGALTADDVEWAEQRAVEAEQAKARA